MESIAPVAGLPRLHVTPVASVKCDAPRVVVDADNEQEKRIQLTFEPYQAMRMVTADCFYLPEGASIAPQTIVEIQNSEWVKELREASEEIDCEADFMNKARHFLLPLEDDFLEIVAWNVTCDS